MGGQVKYRAYKLLAPALVMAYALTALLATQVRGGRELFPFFNWSLFSSASNPKSDVVIIVHAIDGRPLERPKLFFDLPGQFAAANDRSAAAAKTFDLLAAAIVNDNAAAERRYRWLVEDLYLREARAIDYDVARITFDPIERFETGEIRATRVLASYEKHDDGVR